MCLNTRRKDSSNDLAEANFAVCQSGKGHNAICKQFKVHYSAVRKIILEF